MHLGQGLVGIWVVGDGIIKKGQRDEKRKRANAWNVGIDDFFFVRKENFQCNGVYYLADEKEYSGQDTEQTAASNLEPQCLDGVLEDGEEGVVPSAR